MMELGGNIVLEGFKDMDSGHMTIIKKIVGNSTRKITDYCTNFEKMKITLKEIAKKEGNPKFEFHVSCSDNGKLITTEVVDRNILIGLSAAMQKIENQLNK